MIDTSREAVERLAEDMDMAAMRASEHDNAWLREVNGAAATLRALLAERDAARNTLRTVFESYRSDIPLSQTYIREITAIIEGSQP